MTRPRECVVVHGAGLSRESLDILRLIVEGDLAGYDPDSFGPEWVAFWRINGSLLMNLILTLINRYEPAPR